MEKESVKKFDLEAAFKALDEIEIPQTKGIKANRVNLKERFTQKPAHETLVEDYYDVSSTEDLEEAKEEREGEIAQAKLARIEKIVDLDAETADDLLPSYVGKVIMQCPQCMTLFYKNPEDIEHSEENPDVVNINEVCQHCGNTSGYTLIGKVDSVSEEEADKYEAAENGEAPAEEESELDLEFSEPTEEVDAEGTGEGAEELSEDELAELDLDLAEVEGEEKEEEKKEESLNLSKETSENETEHKSENLTLNEDAFDYDNIPSWNDETPIEKGGDIEVEKIPVTTYFLDCSASWGKWDWEKELAEIEQLKHLADKGEAIVKEYFVSDHIYDDPNDARKNGSSTGFKEVAEYAKAHPEEKCIVKTDDDYKTQGGIELEQLPNVELRLRGYNEGLKEAAATGWAVIIVEPDHETVIAHKPTEEEANKVAQIYKERGNEVRVEKVELPIKEELTEEVDKDLDKKLKAHNEYIEYLQKLIKEDEEALKKAENEEIKAAIQRHLDSLNADLEAALPDALKADAVVEEPAETETEEVEVEEEPVEEEAPVEEALTEDGAEEEKPAEEPKEEGTEVNYVDYKHSYCHALAPKLKAINYLVNVKKVDVNILKGYIFKLLKDSNVRWTEKEKEFKKNLEEKTDAYDILNYIKNSIEKAKTIIVKVNEKGELIEGLNEGFEGCLYEVLTESLKEDWRRDLLNIKAPADGSIVVGVKVSEPLDNAILSRFERIVSAKDEGTNLLRTIEEAKEHGIKKILVILDTTVDPAVSERLDKVIYADAVEESLTEGVDSEIDSIIASWGMNEGLTEESNLDRLLDSEEFQTPVSEAEIEAAREEANESLKECGETLTEDPDDEAVASIMRSWVSDNKDVEIPEISEEDEEDLELAEDPQPEGLTASEEDDIMQGWHEGYTGNPAERTTHLEYTDDDPTDGKAVLPDNIEKQLTEDTEEVLTEGPIGGIKNILGKVTNKKNIDALNQKFKSFWVVCWLSAGGEDKSKRLEFTGDNALQKAMDYAKAWSKNPDSGEYGASIFGDDPTQSINRVIKFVKGVQQDSDIRDMGKKIRAKAASEKSMAKAAEKAVGAKTGAEAEAERVEKDPEPAKETTTEQPAEQPAATTQEPEQAPAEEAPKTDEPKTEEPTGGKLSINDAVAKLKAKYPNNDKQIRIVAAMLKNAGIAESLEEDKVNTLYEAVEALDTVEDLNEETFNSKINNFLTEVYSNVKSFEATNCELTEEKLIVEGKIHFNSGNEKLTVFEFLPNYGEGKLFFEGYNKDFSENNAFTLNFSINESKEFITESFGYKYKINETLVEGLK